MFGLSGRGIRRAYIPRVGNAVVVHDDGHEYVHFQARLEDSRKIKCFRKHAHNRDWPIVERNRASENCRIRAELLPPESVGQHDCQAAPLDAFFASEGAPLYRLYSEHLKEISGYRNPADGPGLTKAGQFELG